MDNWKGTKGEWVIINLKEVEEGTEYPGIDCGNKSVVMFDEAVYGADINTEENLANAKLIAAAPDLLNALQKLIHLHNCEEEGLTSGQPTASEWRKATQDAREAIKKALK